MAKSFNSIKAGWSNPNKELGKKKSFKDIKSADYDFGVGEDYIKSFLDRSKEYFDNVESETSSVNFKNAKSKYSSNQDKIQTLVNEARTLRAYYNVNKGKLDSETYNSMMEHLDGFERDSSSVLANYRNKADMYSKFKTEAEYNDAVKVGELHDLPSAEIEKQMGFSRDTYETELAPLKEEYNKLNKDIQFYGRGDKSRFKSAKDYNDAKIRRDKLKKQMTDLKGKNGIAYTTSSGQNITWAELYKNKKFEEDFNALYGELSSAEDWEKYVQKGAGFINPTQAEAEGWATIGGGIWGGNDNDGTHLGGKSIGNIVTYSRDNAEGIQLGGAGMVGDHKYRHMTEDEVNIYNYYLGKYGEEKANNYLKELDSILMAREDSQMTKGLRAYAEEHPVTASGLSVWQNLGAGGEFIKDTAKYIATSEMDSNSLAKASSTIRGTVSEKYDWEVGDWDVFDFLYNTGMSMADSIASTTAFGQFGGVALGLSAAASGTNDALDRGMSKGQAFMSGLASGIFEGVFETWSIGAFGDLTKNLKRADFRNLAKYIGKNMWNNAKEETLTEIANIAYDTLVNGDFSQYETAVRQYMNTGMSESDAKVQVAKELGVQVAEAAGSGALMGFGFGVGGGAKARQNLAQSGRAIKDAGEARNLVELGKSLGEGTESYEAANKIGDKSRALAIGRLMEIVGEDIPNANKVDMIKAFEEKGYNTKEANLLVNKMTEQGLDSVANIRGMRSPAQTYNDVLNDPNSTISQRNEAYRGIGQNVRFNQLQREMSQAVKNKSAIAPHKDSTDGQGKLPTQEEKPIESKFESNTEGKDFNSKNDKIIASKKLVSSEKDNMKFEVTYDDGTTDTVDANDINFSNEGEALVYSYVMDMNVPVGIAEPLISGYKGNDVNSAGTYINGMREAFVFGKHNQEADLHRGAYASQLTEEQRNNAFKIGSIYAKEKAIADEKAIRGETKPTDIKKQEGKVHFEGDKLSLKSVQDVSLESLGVLSKALGKDFHIYESYKDANGKRVYKDANGNIKKAPNGFYRQLDGSIWIDLNAGNSGEGTMMFTVAHELTHFIKQWSPTKFKALADFLVEQYGKEGVSVHELVLAQQEKAKKNGRTISYDVAFEEMVADSMETMLTDGKVIKELAKKDKGLFNKIKSWIDNLLRRLNKEYKNYSPESAEGQMILEMKETFTEVQKLFADALVDASDNFAIKGSDKAFVENYLKSHDVVYNLRAAESHQDKLAEKYTTDASVDLETLQERYAKIIGIWEKLGGELNSKFLNEWNNKVGKDRAFTIFKAQSGYKYNVELSSMCKKGVPLFEAIDTIVKKEVMNELKTKTLGKAEKEILYDILKNHNFEIPCAICYVEQARQREGVIINDFLDGKIEKNSKGKITKYKLGWNDVLNRVEKEMKKNGVDYTFRNVDKSIATDSYAPADIVMDEATQDAFYKALKKVANAEIVRWNREERKSNQKERRQITDLKPQTIKEVFKGTLPSNLKIFKVLFNNPSSRFKISRDLLYSSATTLNLANAHNDLYSLFNSQGGVSGYKTKQAPIVYWGDILGKSWRPSTVRKEGGIRNQSNSDFQMYTLLDQAQMYIDFSAKGYYLQAYTKVLAELKLFGLSRGKINASLIPQVIEYKNADGSINWAKTMENAGLDENGNPIYDDFEGINHTEAFMLIEDAEYSKNICGICIGYSDNHIRKLLDDNRVQQIIGFHDKTDNPEKRYRGAKYAKNYNGLNEAVKVKADGTEETVHIGFNQFVSKAEKMFKFNKKTETFEGTVNHNGKEYSANDIPRLAANLYLEMCAEKNYRPAYNDFSSHKNYYKLLADFGLYDSQGNYAPHQKVQYNMPDQVPYLDKNGNKAYMSTEAYIKAELQKELKVRDSISEALADTSENGIIPQFVERVNALHSEADTTLLSDRDSEGNTLTKEQQEFFKDSEVRWGERLMPVYHGTRKEFTVFDATKGYDENRVGGLLWAAKDYEYAKDYSYSDEPIVMKGYLNITNMLDIGDVDNYADYNKRLQELADLVKLTPSELESMPTYDDSVKYIYDITSSKAFRDRIVELGYDGVVAWESGLQTFGFVDSNQFKNTTNTNPTSNPDIRYSERDYPIDAEVEKTVKSAYVNPKGKMHKLSDITSEQNKAINRLVNQTNNDSYRGKYEGGKHWFADNNIRHIINEHGDFLREGLRAQLPMTLTDIARHLSAVKDNKKPSDIKPTKTKQGNPSILTSYEVNGYTLYAEEIKKPLGNNLPSDLIGHTMYKAPTLSTAAFYTTSVQTQPKRQSEVLCEYNTPNSTNLSRGNFVADKNGSPALLNYIVQNGSPKQDARASGLIALSSDSSNFTDNSKTIEQGYVMCKKPFHITQENRVFSNSDTNVAKRINELKKEGYDCFIFDKTVGDNYMVAVVNKAQIIADEPNVVYSERDTDSVSTRSLLANALEGTAQNDIEKNKLAQYKEKIALIEAEQQKLHELREKLFTKGVKGDERRKIQDEATRTANRINTYDRQLFNLESTTALKNVLNREKTLAMKKQKQRVLKEYKERVSKTEMRHKVKKVVNDLNNLLLKPTKERHIPEEMRVAVAEALDIINMDTVDAETRVAKYNELIAKANDPDAIASFTESRDRILNQGTKLGEKLDKLKSAYGEIKASGDDNVNSMYDDVIYSKIEKVQKDVGKTPLRNMTLGQLESVYELYKMVLTTVRDSNKAFAEDLKMTRQALGSNTFAEIKENNKKRDKIKHELTERFGWMNLKPMQAMKTIGSNILQKLWNNILYGQEVFAQDYDEAVKFAKTTKEKYGYDKWDLNKRFSFESKSGKVMEISLEQMMSIYAYSKRKQADEHIEKGGILLNEILVKEKKLFGKPTKHIGKTVEYKLNDSTAYRFDKLQVGMIVDTLEKEYPGAKDFVDEMQKYLSETMGEKGNEVSMKMYGIKLFKEEHYFPLKSSKDFMEAANDKLKGDVKIKNKGMTKSTVEHASNPIVLENFLDVWGDHINEMAMYHGLVLPLEDFSRTLNYGFKADEKLNTDAESVKTALHNAFGESAEKYLNELLKAINGGVLHDSSESIADKMLSRFKKAKVMASLSVIIQQPTAIIRAMGIIDPKYFVTQNFHHKATWEELKKYCPTAIIKETGSFDTNMGRTIVDMIKEDRKFTEKVGDTLGKAPAYMDEMGWNVIWRALKNKVATEQNLSGEELLKECGKQMTLIINETQVYDSVMSRNEFMRSKSVFNKMATSFMAEPTTVANMIYGAALDIKRGNKKIGGKTIAAVISSVIINGLVSSLVYAFRDDDEEKTWLEKYLSSATTELIDGINLFTYFPYIKDAYSLIQGYDVERTDIALIGDVVDAIDDFYNVLDPEAYEGMSRGEIAKHIYENAKPLLTSICDMFGLPVGNILRDAEAIIVNDNLPMSKTSGEGIGLAAKEGWLNSSPKIVQKFVDDEKYHKLYLIANNGDTAYVKSEVAEMVAEKLDTYKEEEDTLVKAEKKAKQTVKSSFTGVYRDAYKKAYKKKDLEEMNRIRKFLYATNLWKSLSELDKLLSKWREDA